MDDIQHGSAARANSHLALAQLPSAPIAARPTDTISVHSIHSRKGGVTALSRPPVKTATPEMLCIFLVNEFSSASYVNQ
jgi:hypothetical protein